jgi:hypothetical protein
MKRILVVANRTLCEQHLLDALRRRRQESAVAFHLVVPASHPAGPWSDARSEAEARVRLDDVLETLAACGIGATGEVGDPNPVTAVHDVLRREPFDAIIVSTLPVGLSRWLSQHVVRRLANETGLPVTHVVAESTPAAV